MHGRELGRLAPANCFLVASVRFALRGLRARIPDRFTMKQTPSCRRIAPGEALMCALGLSPLFIEDAVGAAMCAMPVKKYRAICPVRPIESGRGKLVRPVDEVKKWMLGRWLELTGQEGASVDGQVQRFREPDWVSSLPASAKPYPGAEADDDNI